MGRGPALAPSGHPFGAGQSRAPPGTRALERRLRLHFPLQHAILCLNPHTEDSHPLASGQRCAGRWLAGTKNIPVIMPKDKAEERKELQRELMLD